MPVLLHPEFMKKSGIVANQTASFQQPEMKPLATHTCMDHSVEKLNND